MLLLRIMGVKAPHYNDKCVSPCLHHVVLAAYHSMSPANRHNESLTRVISLQSPTWASSSATRISGELTCSNVSLVAFNTNVRCIVGFSHVQFIHWDHWSLDVAGSQREFSSHHPSRMIRLFHISHEAMDLWANSIDLPMTEQWLFT